MSSPAFDDDLRFLQRVKNLAVEQLVTKLRVYPYGRGRLALISMLEIAFRKSGSMIVSTI